MGIEVIKRGVNPDEQVYVATCTRCCSELKWQKKDAERISEDQRDGKFTQVTCPVCKHTVTGY